MAHISRRKFVSWGAKGMALATIPAIFKFNPAMAFSPDLTGDSVLEEYLKHFSVSQDLIRKTMEVALSNGGDYCDLFFQHKIDSYVALEDDAVNKAYTNVDLA